MRRVLFSLLIFIVTLAAAQEEAAAPPGYAATLVRVVDGDTVVVMINLGWDTYTQKILRLARVDTPELVGKMAEAGKKAQDFTMASLANRKLIVQPHGKDVYGRWVSSIIFKNPQGEWEDLSDALINGGYGEPYQPKKSK